jgi:tetratricopeptide (TPR) repeat protein
VTHGSIGQLEKQLEEGREALRLNPDSSFPYGQVGGPYLALGRLEEAKAVYEQAVERKRDTPGTHVASYRIAFLQGDSARMQKELAWLKERSPANAFGSQAGVARRTGKLREARAFAGKAAETQGNAGFKEAAALALFGQAMADALAGHGAQAREAAAAMLKIADSREVLWRAALLRAETGDVKEAESLLARASKEFPATNTLAAAVILPSIRARVDLARGNPAKAVEVLQSATPYDARNLGVLSLRANALLAAGKAAEAGVEFEKVIDRSRTVLSESHALAHLSLARAAAKAGDAAKSRRAYQDFLALWKDADPDVPVLIEAKREYAALK